MIQIEGVIGTMVYCAIIWFVLMNAHYHIFGYLIGPTLLNSSK